MNEPLYIVDEIAEVIARVDAIIYPGIAPYTNGNHINFQYGRSIQINKLLQLNKNSIPARSNYPLIALFQDLPEDAGKKWGYTYITIPRITIATITDKDGTPADKYNSTFKPILYPIYTEFINQLSRQPSIIGFSPNKSSYMKYDRPGTRPEIEGFNDYIDAITIENLQLTFYKPTN